MRPLLAQRPFEPFGPSHWGVVALFIAGAAALVAVGRRHRGTAAATRFSRGFALAIGCFLVPVWVYWAMPERWGIGHSLPLQLCDLAAVTAVWALWTGGRVPAALTYFWGLTLTAQAFVTPELNSPDFPSPEFISFWGQHCLIVWAAVYLAFGLGYGPDWPGYWTAIVTTVAWALVMLVFNAVAGTNYGFLNAKPLAGSVLDVLGPWPWYLFSELVVGLVFWALITWPWGAGRRRPRGALAREALGPGVGVRSATDA